jgi:hypothetical protein
LQGGQDLHPIFEQGHLFFPYFFEDLNSWGWIHEFSAVHPVKELLDCVFLLKLVEPHNAFFPDRVMLLKFHHVRRDDFLNEFLVLCVL